MKVYCIGCKNYGENYGSNYFEWCEKRDFKTIKQKGNYREPPREEEYTIEPSEKNKNNDCKDYEGK